MNRQSTVLTKKNLSFHSGQWSVAALTCLFCTTAPSRSEPVPVGASTRRGRETPLTQRISIRRRSVAKAVDAVLRLDPVSFLIYLHPSAWENPKDNHSIESLKWNSCLVCSHFVKQVLDSTFSAPPPTPSSGRRPRRWGSRSCWTSGWLISPTQRGRAGFQLTFFSPCLQIRSTDSDMSGKVSVYRQHLGQAWPTASATHWPGCSGWSVWWRRCSALPAQSAWTAPPGTTRPSPPSAPCKHTLLLGQTLCLFDAKQTEWQQRKTLKM